MILNIKKAEYLEGYKINLTFNSGDSLTVDLEETVKTESRKIFLPLQNLDYFKKFEIRFNTISWENEADFAPEFLVALGKAQSNRNKSCA